jgi:ubiquinone/menaquinone biosynthesis C-methylase UbiE
MADEYTDLSGYAPDADLKLGCGLPTEFARIKPGDTVVDLGSGAGNDCFVARAETGASGQVIGVDFTDAMLLKARTNVLKLGFKNVSFVKGDIENIPLPEATADVVVSNCVFNLVPDKSKAFAETHRILKTGGHFSISDIVLEGELPVGLQSAAEMYAGCVSGAIQMNDYLQLLKDQGFQNLTVQKKKSIVLPKEVLAKYLSAEAIQLFNRDFGIYSITVYGEK